jgi:hypothetical protein
VRNLHPISEKAPFSQRARIANTLSYRRRKGTAAMLEQLAHDTTGWDAKVVEFFKLLDTTQYINHIRLDNYRSPDIRESEKLELLDTPFDKIAHTAEVRHIENRRGRYNISNIGIYLWRLQAYPVIWAPAFSHGDGKFSFSQLGNDIQLFHHPQTEQDITHLAEEINVPTPIRRRAFFISKELYYDKDKSLHIRAYDRDITPDEIVPCDLSDWNRDTPSGKVAVDPVLGRIVFSNKVKPSDVQVYYYYGFSSEVGGGFYDRHAANRQIREDDIMQYDISKSLSLKTIKDAMVKWNTDQCPNAIFYIKDSQVYDELDELKFNIPAGKTLEIRAANEERPVLHLHEPLKIKGEKPAINDQPGGQMKIDGLLIDGSISVQDGDLECLQILHSTLVPVVFKLEDGKSITKGQESLVVKENSRLNITINRSITGSINIENAYRLFVQDSIIDGLDGSAIAGPSVIIDIEESTIIGSVSVRSVKLGSNSIFTGKVFAERKQEGCMRFCYIPNDSGVPRQYYCQPGAAIQSAIRKELCAALAKDPGMTPHKQKKLENKIRKKFEKEIPAWLKPCFTDLHYGNPGYAQLHLQCPEEISKGADDEAEMGVFHHLQQPQRETNLRASLDEYLRVGLEAGIFYIT